MKHFVYAFYSPLYKMVKIGKSSVIENRWKQLSYWNFNADKSFALCCNSEFSQKRIEDTLKEFFKLHPSIEALSTNQDGYTECFDVHIMEEVRDFFQYFSKRYSNNCTYVKNIKPFLNLHENNFNKVVISPLLPHVNTWLETIDNSYFELNILSKEKAINFLEIDPSDF